MSNGLMTFVSMALGVLIGTAAGIYLARVAVDDLKDACQKQHNVYECRVSATPIDPFHPEEPNV